jgi:hypothetical protein
VKSEGLCGTDWFAKLRSARAPLISNLPSTQSEYRPAMFVSGLAGIRSRSMTLQHRAGLKSRRFGMKPQAIH